MVVIRILEMAIIKLWPLWVLLLVVAAWKLWFAHVRAETIEAVTPQSRRRWQLGFILAGALLLVCYVDMASHGRPHQGVYHPVQIGNDGQLAPAALEGK